MQSAVTGGISERIFMHEAVTVGAGKISAADSSGNGAGVSRTKTENQTGY